LRGALRYLLRAQECCFGNLIVPLIHKPMI
jgi:hypothetical protein